MLQGVGVGGGGGGGNNLRGCQFLVPCSKMSISLLIMN